MLAGNFQFLVWTHLFLNHLPSFLCCLSLLRWYQVREKRDGNLLVAVIIMDPRDECTKPMCSIYYKNVATLRRSPQNHRRYQVPFQELSTSSATFSGSQFAVSRWKALLSGRRILPARLGRKNPAACLCFGLRCPWLASKSRVSHTASLSHHRAASVTDAHVPSSQPQHEVGSVYRDRADNSGARGFELLEGKALSCPCRRSRRLLARLSGSAAACAGIRTSFRAIRWDILGLCGSDTLVRRFWFWLVVFWRCTQSRFCRLWSMKQWPVWNPGFCRTGVSDPHGCC